VIYEFPSSFTCKLFSELSLRESKIPTVIIVNVRVYISENRQSNPK